MNKVQYTGYNSQRGYSPAVWGDCPILEMIQDNNVGHFDGDDFLHFQSQTSTEIHSGYYSYIDGTTATIKPTAAKFGECALFNSTDDEECAIQRGDNVGAPWIISDTAADAHKLWFEVRVKKSAITDSLGGFLMGLASEAAPANSLVADAGADIADIDFIGFWNDETDDSTGSHVHFIYQKTGQAFVTKIDTAATLVADTYIKLGFVYDPHAVSAKRIAVYVDGARDATYVTGTNIATATFPDGEEMAFLAAIKSGSNDDLTVTLDWWRVAQLATV